MATDGPTPSMECPPGRTARVCLKCPRVFCSEGNYNRICERCNRENAATGRAAQASNCGGRGLELRDESG